MAGIAQGLAGLALMAATAVSAQHSALPTEQEAAAGMRQADQGSTIRPTAQAHLDAAAASAGQDFLAALHLCNQARPEALRLPLPSTESLRGAGPILAELLRRGETLEQVRDRGGYVRTAPSPTRVFDNFYYLGIEDASAWAIDTSEGIILIDALDNAREWQQRIEPGMRRIGLDPARIRYIIITHGHGDHFGGADYLQRTYGARVLMSAADWDSAPSMVDKPFFDPPPPRDMVAADGDTLTLGDTTVTMHLTPGHTRGTISLLFPLRNGDALHMAALWGGTGFNFPHTPERFAQYAASAARFRALALAAGADVPLSPHAEQDSAIHKIARLGGSPHPFVMGEDGVRRFLTAFEHCALAYREQVLPPLVAIPGGPLLMGSAPGDPADNGDEGPQHPVTIAPFALAARLVTRGEYARFALATDRPAGTSCFADPDLDGRWVDTPGLDWRNPGFAQADDHPAVCVSWEDATAYAAWLSAQDGRRYRLPTEAEYELAARDGTSGTYVWPGGAADGCRFANGGDASAKRAMPALNAAECDDGFAFTSPVGSYPANSLGLFDMFGNVWQLMADCYHLDYNGAPASSAAWTTGCDGENMAARGGSFMAPVASLRPANRSSPGREERRNYIGFRLAEDR